MKRAKPVNTTIIFLSVILFIISQSTSYALNPITAISKKENQSYTSAQQTEDCITIPFAQGWNLFSVPYVLDSSDLEFNFQDLVADASLVKIQDENGWSYENMGIFGDWTNNIGDIQLDEGYKIKMNSDDTIEFCGVLPDYPYPIPLHAGWNIIGYPSTDVKNAMEVIEPIINEGTLVKMQNESGYTIENFGIYGGWQNNIGNLEPGKGYKVKMNEADTLWILSPSSDTITDTPVNPGVGFQVTANISEKHAIVEPANCPELFSISSAEVKHFDKAYIGNGTDHMSFHLVEIPKKLFFPGDEIAIFDGNSCVGAVTVDKNCLTNNMITIPASSNDDMGMQGFISGNQFAIRCWKLTSNEEFILNYSHLSGDTVFTKNGTVLLALNSSLLRTSKEQPLMSSDIICYPNPFTNRMYLKFNLGISSTVEINVFNQMGQIVRSLFANDLIPAGQHQIEWNGKNAEGHNLPRGVYIIQVTLNQTQTFKQLIIKN